MIIAAFRKAARIILCDRKANTLPSVFGEKKMFARLQAYSFSSGVRDTRATRLNVTILLASDLTGSWRNR